MNRVLGRALVRGLMASTILAGVALPAQAQNAAGQTDIRQTTPAQNPRVDAPEQTVRAASDRAAPALVVTLVVDQLSSNLLTQYRGKLTGGLKTLLDQGLVSANGFQTHGVTVTCAGHSTVLTGAHPARTGIPGNDWIDTTLGRQTYCLESQVNTLAHGRNTDNGPVGSERLKVDTLGDWLKAVSPQSRVFAVSGKDRGAINLAGHKGDGAYWLTEGFGFTTYVEPGQTAEGRLAPIADLNRSLIARFSRETPVWNYQREDCRKLEDEWVIGGETFKSQLPPARDTIDGSPLLDELTLEAATHLLKTQELGRRGHTDMLGVSLSATDRIGHGYGTQGPEMCEQIYRMDAALGEFLKELESIPGGVILALTADHGGSDFPERTQVRGYPYVGRTDGTITRRINEVLKTQFGLDAGPLVSSAGGLVVVDGDKKSLPEPLRTQVVNTAIELLNKEPHVALAVSRDELLAEPIPESIHPQDLTVRQRLRLSAAEGRSPDILRANQPGLTNPGRIGQAISSHGSPWDYDRGVPIIFWWPGAQGQERFMPVRTIDIAPTLANLLGVTPTGQIDGRCMDLPEFTKGKCEN